MAIEVLGMQLSSMGKILAIKYGITVECRSCTEGSACTKIGHMDKVHMAPEEVVANDALHS